MAVEDDWEKVKEEITCAVCYELFTDPRTLPCLHTFCKACIQRSIATRSSKVPAADSFECPLCRACVPLPAKGIDGISSSFSAKRLIEIYDKRQAVVSISQPNCRVCLKSNPASMWCVACDCPICTDCISAHSSIKVFAQHKIIAMKDFTGNAKKAIEASFAPGLCPIHPDQVLKFYCYTCEQTICVECALLDHPRGDHNFDSIGKIIATEKDEMLKTVAPLGPMREKVLEAMKRVAADSNDDQCKQNVCTLFDKLHKVLEKQKETVLKKLDLVKHSTRKSLDIQATDLLFLEGKLKSCTEFVSNLMNRSSTSEIMSLKSQVASRVDELISLMEGAPLEPLHSCMLDSMDLKEFSALCGSVCRVFCAPHPSNCTASKPLRHYIQVDECPRNAVSITVTLQDVHGNPVTGQARQLELETDEDDEFLGSLVIKEERGSSGEEGAYKITYQPSGVDDHTVGIKWKGVVLMECEVPAMLRDYTTLRTEIPVKSSNDDGSSDKDVSDDGSDMSNKTNSSSDRVTYRIIEKFGPEDITFGNIGDIANGPDGELIVADTDNDRMIVFDEDLNYSHTIGKHGADEGELSGPYGVVCNEDGQLFVADTDNNRIQVFELDGTFVSAFGEYGSEDGEFNGPTRLALGSTGLLYVIDMVNRRIQMFDTQKDYQFQANFGEDQLFTPISLSLNSTRKKLFVTDVLLGILVFSPEGQFLQTFSLDVYHCGALPSYIHCTSDQHLLISCHASNKFLGVVHEDGSAVTSSMELWKSLDTSTNIDDADEATCAHAVNIRSNGQIVIAFQNKKGELLEIDQEFGLAIIDTE